MGKWGEKGKERLCECKTMCRTYTYNRHALLPARVLTAAAMESTALSISPLTGARAMRETER